MSNRSGPKIYARALHAVAACGLSVSAMAGGGDCQQNMTRLDAEGAGAGQISASEHAAQATKRFQAMDLNNDGRLTDAEIDASHGAESMVWAKHRMSAAEKIAQLDADEDGALTRAEYASGSQKMFKRLDLNGDGTLSAREMQIDSLTASE